ncbi:MAG TPA: sensor histidine kinase [Firmicutes bacterium]|nr:sensor histidine kinase [Bacillota bacterium]
MTPLLVTIIVVLLILNLFQYHRRNVNVKQLNYISDKLSHIYETDSNENILLFTENKDVQTLLIEINHLIEEKNKVKIEYTKKEKTIKKMISNMSHDLKTPLTVMLGTTEMLIHDKTMTKEEQSYLLEKVYRKVLETSYQIDKFFDLSKLESGDTLIHLNKINVNSVCQNGILFFYESITSHGLEVILDIPKTPIYALLNEDALTRILQNLIHNAIAYGSEGKVIGLSVKKDNKYVYIEVWDAGKGIDAKYYDLIFERLYTLEDSRNRLYQGSGLGLAITKKLVEKMDGTIAVKSTPYIKTVFTLKFEKAISMR